MERQDHLAALKAEQAAFDAQLDGMLKEHAGESVIFKDGKPVGFFGNYEDAYRVALEQFGSDGVFLVSEVKVHSKQPVSVSWDLGLMFAEG